MANLREEEEGDEDWNCFEWHLWSSVMLRSKCSVFLFLSGGEETEDLLADWAQHLSISVVIGYDYQVITPDRFAWLNNNSNIPLCEDRIEEEAREEATRRFCELDSLWWGSTISLDLECQLCTWVFNLSTRRSWRRGIVSGSWLCWGGLLSSSWNQLHTVGIHISATHLRLSTRLCQECDIQGNDGPEMVEKRVREYWEI